MTETETETTSYPVYPKTYPAIWTRSQRGELSADYESVAHPGHTFIFLLKRKTQQCSYFRCALCAKAMKLRARRNATRLTVPIVRASLEDGFIDDPDNPLHRHFCIDEEGVDTTTYAAKARFIYNKVKLELMDMPMTPRQAWLQMEAEVMANFPDSETQKQIISRLPSDKSAKRSFARRSSLGRRNLSNEMANLERDDYYYLYEGDELDEDNGGLISVDDDDDLVQNDPRNVPVDLWRPYRSRPPWICTTGRERLANFFLIYRDCRPNCPPFMVFSDIMGINLIHKCADIVCDGNSNFYPRGFAQLYTFHAVHPIIPEEAHLCAFALLPNTAPATYIKLFDVLSERMLAEYGDNGIQKNWHFDNQYAAINGCRAIFPDDVVEGSEERTANFAHLWHEHLRSLFFGTHPSLARFIRVMREELARASIQAERIFPRPPPVTAVNLDNLEIVNIIGTRGRLLKREEEDDPYLMPYPSMSRYRYGPHGSMGMLNADRIPLNDDDNNADVQNQLPENYNPYIPPYQRRRRRKQQLNRDGDVPSKKEAKAQPKDETNKLEQEAEAEQLQLDQQPCTSASIQTPTTTANAVVPIAVDDEQEIDVDSNKK